MHSNGEENSDPYESSEEENTPKFINSYLRNQDESDSSSKEECECNHYKAILNINGICIYILTIEENHVLNFFDKIEYPKEK